MNNQDYEQKKRECWEEFTTMPLYKAFSFAFDRAYALGKKEIKQEIKQETDAEDILCVSREKVKEAFDTAKKIATSKMSSKMLSGAADMVCKTLDILFGSKCLPDEEQIAENANCSNVDSLSQNPPENCNKANHISTDDSKPAETTDFGREVNFPTKSNIAEKRNLSKDCDKQLDSILTGSFLKERRLNVATRVLCGMMADPISSNIQGKPTPVIVKWAYQIADALIAEAEKGAEG